VKRLFFLFFSLISLITPFSAFAVSFPATGVVWVANEYCGPFNNGSGSDPASACKARFSNYPTYVSSVGYQLNQCYHPSTGRPSNWSCGSRSNVILSNIGTCAANSTNNAGTCSPNAGFNAVYSGTYTNGAYSGGSWSIKTVGSECPANSQYEITGTCSAPVAPVPTHQILGSVAALIGLAIAGAGFVTAAPIVLAGGLALAAHGALFASGHITNPDFTTATKAANTTKQLTIELDPTKSLLNPPINNSTEPSAVISPTKTIQPKGGNASNVWSTKSDGSKELTNYSPNGPRVVGSISADGTTATVYGSPTSPSPVTTRTQVASDGSSHVVHSGSIPSKNPTTGAVTSTAVVVSNVYDSTGLPVSSTVNVSSTNADGSSTAPATVTQFSCEPNQPNCEATQRLVFNSIDDIKNNLNGQGVDVNVPLNGIEGRLNNSLDTVKEANTIALLDFLENTGIKESFESLLPVSPWKALAGDNQTGSTSNCSFDIVLFNQTVSISLCAAQPYIHTALNFIFFFLMVMGIFGIIFERQE
jgi:hypothetical protein